jgi:uncharacterized metal-binding protein YceD (DUF177 family)
MHINVRDILIESVGYSQTYKISGERPKLEGVRLTKDIEGEITVSKLDVGLQVRGHVTTEIELECHRCLSIFNRPTEVYFSQEYSEAPEDDELPITDGEIDLGNLIEQEIVLHLPIKIICKPDCRGIENAPEKYTKENTDTRLANQARITKGTKRGRT